MAESVLDRSAFRRARPVGIQLRQFPRAQRVAAMSGRLSRIELGAFCGSNCPSRVDHIHRLVSCLVRKDQVRTRACFPSYFQGLHEGLSSAQPHRFVLPDCENIQWRDHGFPLRSSHCLSYGNGTSNTVTPVTVWILPTRFRPLLIDPIQDESRVAYRVFDERKLRRARPFGIHLQQFSLAHSSVAAIRGRLSSEAALEQPRKCSRATTFYAWKIRIRIERRSMRIPPGG